MHTWIIDNKVKMLIPLFRLFCIVFFFTRSEAFNKNNMINSTYLAELLGCEQNDLSWHLYKTV